MSLIINSLGVDTHTYTQAHTHACTHTDICAETIKFLRKQVCAWFKNHLASFV